MTDLIADTNVWYDLGLSRRDPVDLKAGGHRLLVSPVSFIEIASRISERTINDRRTAAQAVLDHADELLLDPERHLAGIWGLEVESLTVDWREGFQAIAEAEDADQLTRGVEDFNQQVVRRVNIALAAQLRNLHYEDFETQIIDVIDSNLAGYKAARMAGQAKYMKKAQGDAFECRLNDPSFELVVLMGTWARASLHLSKSPLPISSDQINAVRPALMPYVNAYRAYLLKVATKFAPRSNDWGDLESFVYIQDNRRLVTCDKNWLEIAQDAGLDEHLVSSGEG